MTWGLIVLFGLTMSIAMSFAAIYYKQNLAAKQSAIILARVMPTAQVNDELYARATKPERLADSPRLQRLLFGVPFIDKLAALLEEAGSKTTVASALTSMGGAGVATGLVAFALNCSLPGSVFLALVACVTPLFHYQRQRSARILAFEAQLPQMMEMLTLYLRTGRSLPQAFTAVAEEIPAPASEELALCAEEYRLGRPLPIALKGLSQKYPESLGLKLFSIAISVLGQTGGNLVEVLERIKRTLDASISYVLKLRSMTGEARTSASILGALPGLFMVISAFMNPKYFNMFFDSTAGLALLGLFCSFWAAGIIWLRVLMASRA